MNSTGLVLGLIVVVVVIGLVLVSTRVSSTGLVLGLVVLVSTRVNSSSDRVSAG